MNVIMKILSTDFTVEFLENGKRYIVEKFMVHLLFNKLSNVISFISVAEKFCNLYMFKVCQHLFNLSIFSKIVIDIGLKISG